MHNTYIFHYIFHDPSNFPIRDLIHDSPSDANYVSAFHLTKQIVGRSRVFALHIRQVYGLLQPICEKTFKTDFLCQKFEAVHDIWPRDRANIVSSVTQPISQNLFALSTKKSQIEVYCLVTVIKETNRTKLEFKKLNFSPIF